MTAQVAAGDTSMDADEETLTQEVEDADEAAMWFFSADGVTRHGPVTPGYLEAAHRLRQVDPATMVWCEGMQDWVTLVAEPDVISSLRRIRKGEFPKGATSGIDLSPSCAEASPRSRRASTS